MLPSGCPSLTAVIHTDFLRQSKSNSQMQSRNNILKVIGFVRARERSMRLQPPEHIKLCKKAVMNQRL